MKPNEENPELILQHCRTLGLPENGIAYVREVVTSPPSRNVRNGRGNVTVRFASLKMKHTVQCESHTVEFVFVQIHERRKATRRYYDQPIPIRLNYVRPDGRAITFLHTPDFLTIEDDKVALNECKPRESYQDLIEKHPGRYVLDEAGHLRYPAAENAAAEFGIIYRIWSPGDGDRTLAQNLQFLTDYYREETPQVPQDVTSAVIDVVRKKLAITIEELRRELPALSVDHLYTLIAQNVIFCDLRKDLVSNQKTALLYIDEAMAKAHEIVRLNQSKCDSALSVVSVTIGAQVIWNDRLFEIANFDGDSVQLVQGDRLTRLQRSLFDQLAQRGEIKGLDSTNGQTLPAEIREVFQAATARDFEIATERWEILQDPSGLKARKTPKSTQRRWRHDRKAAEHTFGCGYLGLLPQFYARGNHNPRLPQAVYDLVDQSIDHYYLSLKQRNKRAVFGFIKLECGRRGLPSPSYQWIVDRINSRDKRATILARRGRRAAYRFTPQIHGRPNPNVADRPWALALVDHTRLDICLISDDTGEPLENPWLTLVIDAYSRRALAFAISFDSPSYRILMVMVRLIAQRWGRMPEQLSVDGGKEFSSIYFQTLLALCECSIVKRPPAQPRFGCLIERAFGTLDTSFLYNLAGNSQIMKCVRQVTKSVRPEGQAVWSLESLHDLLSAYFFDLYDNRPHSELGMSPAEKYGVGMKQFGAREHRIIVPNEDFLLMTLPSTPKGTAKVIPQRGVLVRGIYFWAEEMKSSQFEGRQVEIRYNPFNIAECYARLGKRWVKCVSRYNSVFQGKSEKEIMIASEMIRQDQRRFGRISKGITESQYAHFFASQVEPEERLRKQRLKDMALSRIYGKTMETALSSTPSSNGAHPVTEGELTPSGNNGQFSQDLWPANASRILPEL
ncbi:MAG: Mu transposase C-terminal domain-containing protein [Verrucomicrobiota bacterium]